jgi:reverse gyrase
MKTIAMLNEQY